MARTSKVATTSTTTPPETTPKTTSNSKVSKPASSKPASTSTSLPPAPEGEPKVKVVRAKKTTLETPVPVVASSSSVTDSSVPEIPLELLEVPLLEQSTNFLKKLNEYGSAFSQLKTEFRILEKKWARELKIAQKQGAKKRRNPNKAPSGFVRPTPISKELAIFLNLPIGTEIARTEVTKEINNYIKQNDLKNKTNGRNIIPDEKLKVLLKLEDTDELTFFNLQRYIKHHFYKNIKAPEETVAPSVPGIVV
jgi:chromatin remodeling complex protein RSC6